jgi:oligoribonuclease
MSSQPETLETPETPEIAKNGIEGRYDRIVWIDCEMTGLDLSRDVLVEIACIVTDAELNELGEGYTSVIATDEATLAAMLPRVTELHQASGLLPLIAGGISLEQAAAETLAYIKSHVSEPLRAPLAGSTIYVDRGFLARQMPEVDAYLHYRVIDVSSIKELVRRWYPKVYFSAPAKTGNHRALGDIRDSIAELRYYRQTVFTAPKGSR